MMLSTVSLVGQVQAGMDAAMGALMVGIFAVANGAGRLGLVPSPIGSDASRPCSSLWP